MSTTTEQLRVNPAMTCVSVPLPDSLTKDVRAIEEDSFPFEYLSEIAEMESWRKEINRPIYHLHKWWAQRLGSVFRAILLGTVAPQGSDVLSFFYSPARIGGAVIFDPFMGSGTTIGEALKLGGRAMGRDINPVSHLLVKNGMGMPSREEVCETFDAIKRDVSGPIQHFYEARLPDGGMGRVLYYFWVKHIPCPLCKGRVDMFSSYVFAKHAYPKRHPESRAICPSCGGLNVVRYDALEATCASCRTSYKLAGGPVSRSKATCPHCNRTFSIAKVVQGLGKPPEHRLYAKLVLSPSNEKRYLPGDEFDLALYKEAEEQLLSRENAYPLVQIMPGYNTNQVLNYSYGYWHQMFNSRQLLCLSILGERIKRIPDERKRDLFCCFFSGIIEFNNMFASYKGEGTGAVRHMFSHHILKPERTPLEANVWGTPYSSGSFSTLFKTRVLRAIDYCEDPFEIRISEQCGRHSSKKVYGLSSPLHFDSAKNWEEFSKGKSLYLSCGDSSATDIESETVDAIVTDPPFFDNVQYSELADFFYVWQRHIMGAHGDYVVNTTRSAAEVQQKKADLFLDRLAGVWNECHRVLKRNGLLVFTFHHSRSEGWRCILMSLLMSGFEVTACHPIKAEMSVAAPKNQAKEPIDLDMIMVCRKKVQREGLEPASELILEQSVREAEGKILRIRTIYGHISRNDVRGIVMGQIIAAFSHSRDIVNALAQLEGIEPEIERAIERLYSSLAPVEG